MERDDMERNSRHPGNSVRPSAREAGGILSALKARRAAARATRERRGIRAYYLQAPPSSIVLPREPGRRQFRIAIKKRSGRLVFAKIDDRIRDPQTLHHHLVEAIPHHVYFTTSTWLDPQRLGPRDFKKAKKAGYQVAHNVFLDQGLFFDIDVPGDLARAARDTLLLRDLLASEWGFEQFRAVYSGSKGFHLYVDDFRIREFVWEIPASPREREDAHPIAKARFTERALKAGLAVDAACTLDPRRILRVPGTVHGKTLNLCESVELARVETFVPRKIPSDGWRKLLE
jgi:DNA primase catalytic subunit